MRGSERFLHLALDSDAGLVYPSGRCERDHRPGPDLSGQELAQIQALLVQHRRGNRPDCPGICVSSGDGATKRVGLIMLCIP